jgi:hypothetical protein
VNGVDITDTRPTVGIASASVAHSTKSMPRQEKLTAVLTHKHFSRVSAAFDFVDN